MLFPSTCYSEDLFLLPHRSRVPCAFDSEEYIDTETPERQGFPSPSMASSTELESIVTPSGVPNVDPTANRANLLPPLAFRKPPRPALQRPVNLTAYTRPDDYGPYIEQVLTPSPLNAARSSIANIFEMETMSIIRKENGSQFDDQIAHEIRHLMPHGSEVWIRDTVFKGLIPTNFKDIFQGSKAWDADKATFWKIPEFTELGIKSWLNEMIEKLGSAFEDNNAPGCQPAVCPSARSWCKVTANRAPTGGSQVRKPDISLLDRSISTICEKKGDKPGWALVQAFAEVTQNQASSMASMLKNIVEKAYLMFESQPYRLFVIALCFIKKESTPTWGLVRVDRAGVISTISFAFTHTPATTLAMTIYCLSFGNPGSLGIDESMIICPSTGLVTHIVVKGQTPTSGDNEVKRIFEVVRPIHATPQVSGRATRVWIVRRDGVFYILKDSWPLKSKPFSEISHLLQINRMIMEDDEMLDKLKHTYPILVIGQEFKYHDTSLVRDEFGAGSCFARMHRRIVTEPIGDPLTSFNSKFQLCSVLRDVVFCKQT